MIHKKRTNFNIIHHYKYKYKIYVGLYHSLLLFHLHLGFCIKYYFYGVTHDLYDSTKMKENDVV